MDLLVSGIVIGILISFVGVWFHEWYNFFQWKNSFDPMKDCISARNCAQLDTDRCEPDCCKRDIR